MTAVIVAFDLVHVDALSHAGSPPNISAVPHDMGVVLDPFFITLEVNHVYFVEPHQSLEASDVSKGHLSLAGKIFARG